MKHSINETVIILYRSILRRDPTPDEIATVLERIAAGQDLADIAAALASSKEAARYRTALFVPPGHFYSPIVDTATLRERIPLHRKITYSPLPDVDIDINLMTRFWEESLAPYARKTPFPDHPEPTFRFHFNNAAYSYGDAITLRAMILHYQPRRIIEVGSGWSSACTLDTIFEEATFSTEIKFIEPYPKLLEQTIRANDLPRIQIIPKGVQDVPVSEFQTLEENDILFIDSTHVVKTGSDVVYELCEVLPRLNKGVVIHFHDIFYPFEYGYKWAIQQNRSWNEIYALRNFLAFNDSFEVIFFNDMFAQFRRDILKRDCPKYLYNSGGAIWLRRKK